MVADADELPVRIRAHVVFRGTVQGVFFRVNARRCAMARGLTGWVKNRRDGSVEAVFEGEEGSVKAAIDWCSTSQPHARVEGKSVEFSAATGEFGDFSIVG